MHGNMTRAGLLIGSGAAGILVLNGVYEWWAILGCMAVGAFLGAGIDFNLAQAREAAERLQPHCPFCYGKLPDWRVSKCLHCGSDVDLTAQIAAVEAEREKAAAEWAAGEENRRRTKRWQVMLCVAFTISACVWAALRIIEFCR